MSINQVVLSGRLGAEPEISNLKNGNRVANMRLATEKNWKKPDGSWGSKTAWHSITTFNEHLIKRLENYGKGDQVTVPGELDYDIYEDNNGSKQVRAKIIVGERGSKIENHTQVGAKKPRDEGSAPQQGDENTFNDEIPF